MEIWVGSQSHQVIMTDVDAKMGASAVKFINNNSLLAQRKGKG